MNQNWLKFQFPRKFCWDPESSDIVFIPWNPSVTLPFPGFFFRNHSNSGNKWTRFPPPQNQKKWILNGGILLGFFWGGINELFPNVGIHEEITRRGKFPRTNPKKFHVGKERQLFHKIQWNWRNSTLVASPSPSLEWKENSKFQNPNPIPTSELFTSLRKTPQSPHPAGNSGGFIQQIPVWKTRLWFCFSPKLNP